MADPNLLIMVGVVFCLAGFVKGMVGLGLPTVSLGLSLYRPYQAIECLLNYLMLKLKRLWDT